MVTVTLSYPYCPQGSGFMCLGLGLRREGELVRVYGSGLRVEGLWLKARTLTP